MLRRLVNCGFLIRDLLLCRLGLRFVGRVRRSYVGRATKVGRELVKLLCGIDHQFV